MRVNEAFERVPPHDLCAVIRDRQPSALLLDIGGVLCPDPWETIIGTPIAGLAARLENPRLMTQARLLWREFALRPSIESDYWTALGIRAGVRIPLDLVEEITTSLVRPFPWSAELLEAVPVDRLLIVSDNTSFWFARQDQALRLTGRSSHQFLSFREGLSKSSRPQGLLDLAVAKVGAHDVLFVDDRVANVRRAVDLGLTALLSVASDTAVPGSRDSAG